MSLLRAISINATLTHNKIIISTQNIQRMSVNLVLAKPSNVSDMTRSVKNWIALLPTSKV